MSQTLLLAFFVFLAALNTSGGTDLQTCKRDYVKIGCYRETSPGENLLVDERSNIPWNNIEAFVHHLACKCDKQTRFMNKNRAEPFVAFALHYWGLCYGRTQKEMDKLSGDKKSSRCTGDSTFKGCKEAHKECVGQDFAEYIYELRKPADKDVDGGYTLWGSWLKCEGTCGQGVKRRERRCTNPEPKGKGADCSSLGSTTETKSCDTGKKCPINGEYGEWTKYSECSKKCGGGTEEKTRKCDSPAPEHGGLPCDGPSKETRPCNTQKCPINGKLGAWKSWSKCSKKCGGGSRERTRSCTKPKFGGDDCKEPLKESASCNTKKCPINGKLGAWKSWSKCSKKCGGGTRQRKRSCTKPKYGGKDCKGPLKETTSCNTKKCPINGGYSKWSSYSSCNKACNGGTQKRYRSCNKPKPQYKGKKCVGASWQSKSCNTQPCLSSEYVKRVCEARTMSIRCGGSSKITITHALYGRKTCSHCNYPFCFLAHKNCKSGSSWSNVRSRCEGKSSCNVYAGNNVFGDPCWLTAKYLEVKYRCKG